jgi:hypothetical protein
LAEGNDGQVSPTFIHVDSDGEPVARLEAPGYPKFAEIIETLPQLPPPIEIILQTVRAFRG